MIAQDYIDRVKAAIPLSHIVGREVALKRAGAEFKALCPFHAEKTPSFFVNDQKAFFHCFGCGRHGDHVSWLMQMRGLTFEAAIEILAGEKPPNDGIRWESRLRAQGEERLARPAADMDLTEDEIARQEMAQSIWSHAEPIAGSLAETYLRIRGLNAKQFASALRFVSDAWILARSSSDGRMHWRRSGYPGLVACVQDSSDRVTAIQTTYLKADGSWKAPLAKPKLVLGPMLDGAIRLCVAGPVLCISEGIETGLSGQQMYRLPVWAATGQARRKSITLPSIVKTVVILADNTGSKETTETAKLSYEQQGAEVIVEYPPDEYGDFNDLLLKKRKVSAWER